MKIRQNLHIHSRNSCDSACAALDDIQNEMLKLGLKEFGVSDHLHSAYNDCDITSSREEFASGRRAKEFHFGIEVSAMSRWECEKIARGDYETNESDPVYGLRQVSGPAHDPVCIALTEEKKLNWGIEYVIGGVHWALYPPPEREEIYFDYFRQMTALAEDPLVDIIAHPWDDLAAWFKRVNEGKPDYQAVLDIPQKYHDQFCETLLKHNKCAELNLTALTHPRYPEECLKYMWALFAQWREAGVKFVIGSDQHSAHANEVMFSAGSLLLDAYGFKEENIKYFFS